MPFNQQIGRLGKVYIGNESTYGTPPTLTSTDAFRHLDITQTYNNNRRNSEEKKGTPGLTNRFSSHIVAGFDIRRAYLSPSGTIGTAPEAKKLLKGGFGAERAGTGTTTVASAASSTVFTVASGHGADFIVGEMIVVRRAANSSAAEPRMVVTISTDTITVAPALGGTPAAGDTVKACVTYSLTNNLPNSLTVARYLTDISFQTNGCVVDKLGLMFDGNSEVMLSASGPGKDQTRPAQSIPGAFTTVGQPVTGIIGAILFNGTAYKITKLDAQINNAMEVVNDTFGTDRAEDFYRNGRRDITISMDARTTDNMAVYAAAEAAGDATLLIHAGNTEGRIVGLYAPKTEWDVPDLGDGDGALRWSFKGVAKETAGNDELYCFFG